MQFGKRMIVAMNDNVSQIMCFFPSVGGFNVLQLACVCGAWLSSSGLLWRTVYLQSVLGHARATNSGMALGVPRGRGQSHTLEEGLCGIRPVVDH